MDLYDELKILSGSFHRYMARDFGLVLLDKTRDHRAIAADSISRMHRIFGLSTQISGKSLKADIGDISPDRLYEQFEFSKDKNLTVFVKGKNRKGESGRYALYTISDNCDCIELYEIFVINGLKTEKFFMSLKTNGGYVEEYLLRTLRKASGDILSDNPYKSLI